MEVGVWVLLMFEVRVVGGGGCFFVLLARRFGVPEGLPPVAAGSWVDDAPLFSTGAGIHGTLPAHISKTPGPEDSRNPSLRPGSLQMDESIHKVHSPIALAWMSQHPWGPSDDTVHFCRYPPSKPPSRHQALASPHSREPNAPGHVNHIPAHPSTRSPSRTTALRTSHPLHGLQGNREGRSWGQGARYSSRDTKLGSRCNATSHTPQITTGIAPPAHHPERTTKNLEYDLSLPIVSRGGHANESVLVPARHGSSPASLNGDKKGGSRTSAVTCPHGHARNNAEPNPDPKPGSRTRRGICGASSPPIRR